MRFVRGFSAAAGNFSDFRLGKAGVEAIFWFKIGDPGYRPGENSAAAAVWPLRKVFSKCSAHALILSSAPSALANPNFGFRT